MKTSYLTFLLLFSVCLGFAQTKDSLSVEEQERREKNIQAGNPFKKFGYKPKIATLSQGKYLEFHDLDSIVKIGSFSYHVKNKLITEHTKLEYQNTEAGLSPEIISRWMSPDPLSDEFPSWSPYTSMNDNPINFIDPDGRASLWIPKVNENGSTSYIAEAGDSAATLADQFEIGKGLNDAEQLAAAEKITGTSGNTEIEEGTPISGEKVAQNNNGNQVLKLDLSSKLATNQRIFNQFVFATDNQRANGVGQEKYQFLASNYYNVIPTAPAIGPLTGNANLMTENGSVRVNYEITVNNPNKYSNYGSEFPISTYADFTKPLYGNRYNTKSVFYRITNNGVSQTDDARLNYTGNSTIVDAVINRFKKFL